MRLHAVECCVEALIRNAFSEKNMDFLVLGLGCLVENGQVGKSDDCRGLYRDYYGDPFQISSLSTEHQVVQSPPPNINTPPNIKHSQYLF